MNLQSMVGLPRRAVKRNPPWTQLIRNLKSNTFFGNRLTRRQIGAIPESVGRFARLSRVELEHTICVRLRWQIPRGPELLAIRTAPASLPPPAMTVPIPVGELQVIAS